MELQKSAVQTFRHSFNRTKNISIELNSLMKNCVKKTIDFENCPSQKNLVSKDKLIIDYNCNNNLGYGNTQSSNQNQTTINEEEKKNIEGLFKLDIKTHTKNIQKQSILLLNGIQLPKHRLTHLSSMGAKANKKK